MKKLEIFKTLLLSVIAICAIALVAQNQIMIGQLSQGKTENSFVKQASFNPNKNFVNLPINPDGSIDVNIKSANDVIDVNIEEVGGYNTYDVVPVEIKD